MEKTTIIIDTDPGIDDSVAIFAALNSEELKVALITTVAGNVSVEKTTANALKLVKFMGVNVPVAKGCSKPLLSEIIDACHVHGETGMGGYDFPEIGENDKTINDHAVEAMRKLILSSDKKITLVPVGPLTNIAILFSMYPECKNNIERIVMMGGSASRGNQTPMAEYNIYFDPEAAKIVFDSGVDIVMCGLDVTNKSLLTKENVEEIKDHNKTGNAISSMFKHYRGGGQNVQFKMHDCSAIAYLVKPELFTVQKAHIDVEIKGTYTYGCTVVDLEGKLNLPNNATVCVDVNAEKFSEWLVETIKKSV